MTVRDIEAERAVLSDLLIDSRQADAVRRIVGPEAFTSSAHRAIYKAILALVDDGEEPDAASVRAAVTDTVKDAGLVLTEILDPALPPASAHAATHARQLASIAHRRNLRSRAQGIVEAASNGVADRDLRELVEGLVEEKAPSTLHEALQPLSEVEARLPEYIAGGMVRASGLHLWWGPPSNYKTYLGILTALEMTQAEAGDRLLGFDSLPITRPWKRLLWLGDEETAEEWKARAELIAHGHGLQSPGDEILFVDASRWMLTTDHVAELVDLAGNVDAVFIDPLANLVPTTDRDGRPVKVDADNAHALRRVCRPLRQLAKIRQLAVFLLHHPNAGGERERGPTAYRGSADVVASIKLDSGLVILEDVKNRDREKGRFALRPVWETDVNGKPVSVRLNPDELPTATTASRLGGTTAKMYAAVQAGAGKVTRRDLTDASYPGRGREDVSGRSKRRSIEQLVKLGLIDVDPDSGIVRLREAPDAPDTQPDV